MSASSIRPVIPSAQPHPRDSIAVAAAARLRGPLPLARLTERPAGTLRFGLATIDMNGRVADAVLFKAPGWTTDTRLHIQTCADLIVVVADERGVFRLAKEATERYGALMLAPHATAKDIGLFGKNVCNTSAQVAQSGYVLGFDVYDNDHADVLTNPKSQFDGQRPCKGPAPPAVTSA
ncbi:hypothetical protein GCM10010399_64450 [Dactylosporangium fulvum]|uniref:Uncharacterized protein n=1 Tax=Dactylosporangium fulvum TaxID=53359 RepID=A0ABY5W6P3_9ACTN|nr:hypothetical protein [Dactylosporangium fulvum]UWP85733.1 hypothetical protein Dfulv_16425 [Dactylosporangium fulvum]